MKDKELEEWIRLMELAQQYGVSTDKIKQFIEGRNDDETTRSKD